jgi:acyl-CoA reductase-like NAD-dependent aldehyde dehydrogenase
MPEEIHEALLIGGERVDDAERLEVRNPARPGELVGTVVRGTPDHVDQAVWSATRAQPAWAARTFAQRAAILAPAIDRLEEELEARAILHVRENGKPLAQARGELMSVPRRQRTALDYAAPLDAERELPARDGRSFVINRPYGVVVSIAPWNAPDTLAFTQIVAALLAGNAVVVKPPETCPLTLMRSIALFGRGLPPGVLNVVTGLPAEIGDALTTHPDVRKIGFTGSIPSAGHIMANAARSIKGITLELGGNDAAIVLDDVDLDTAIAPLVDAAFAVSGQVCMAVKRLYVPASRAEEFTERFSAAVDALVVGDGLRPAVTMGPLHTGKALAGAMALLDDARDRGGELRELGQVEDAATFADGWFMRPTVVTGLPDDAPLMAQEQFCAALPIATYDDVDEAIARANASEFGLSGSVWTRDTARGVDVARRLEAGQVWVNAHGPQAVNHLAPYGGVKQSGLGRKSGIEGILEYVQTQTVTTREPASG